MRALFVKASMPFHSVHHSRVGKTALQMLSANLRALMTARDDLRTQAKVGTRAGMDQRTVGRILNQEHTPTLAQLDGLARAFGVATWQLLAPDVDPADLPVCIPQSQHDAFQHMRLAAEALTKYSA